jgi:hypothetical protein
MIPKTHCFRQVSHRFMKILISVLWQSDRRRFAVSYTVQMAPI